MRSTFYLSASLICGALVTPLSSPLFAQGETPATGVTEATTGPAIALDPPAETTPAKPVPPAGTVDLSGGTKNRIPESILQMSDENKQKLNGLLQDAATYLGGIRIQEAFEKLVEAEAMAPDYSAIHNLKGAAYTKLRHFRKAEVAFKKAIELDPDAFMSHFNLTEIYFVSGDFPKASNGFKNLTTKNPEMPDGTKALIDFKRIICHLRQNDEAGARALLGNFDFLDDHPGYYFGHAAIEFQNGKEDEAKRWIRSAERIYDRNQVSIYTDSFIEVGWLEHLQ